jgi:FeS assembly SUF system protein
MNTQASAAFEPGSLRERAIAALRTIHDPEIPVNLYDLGLIYALDVDTEARAIRITMTLTAPGCPVAATFPGEVELTVRAATGADTVTVTLTFDPPWCTDRMTEAARLQLGMW